MTAPTPREGTSEAMGETTRRPWLSGYATVLAISALAGGLGLIVGYLKLPKDMVHRLPFASPALGGSALLLAVGLPATVLAILAWRGSRRVPEVATLTGVLLIGWIGVELAFLRAVSFLQPLYASMGLVLILWSRSAVERAPARLLHLRTPPRQHQPCSSTTGQAHADTARSAIDLLWIPVGAGGHTVRFNAKLYEALCAHAQHRRPRPLFHAALEVWDEGVCFIVEMAPAWNLSDRDRGVVLEGPVGTHWLGRSRWFRYEIRCWPGGRIPDRADAVDSPQLVSGQPDDVARVLRAVSQVPALTWGRDELRAGEMWNSNSLIAWVLAIAGLDTSTVKPPRGGRAPGWNAGLALSARSADTTG